MGNNPTPPAPGKGRPPGSVNKATAEIKAAFKNLIELNTPNMIGWLERVAQDNPAKALEICGSLAEFIVPKLARTELTGKDGGAIEAEITNMTAEEAYKRLLDAGN